MDRWKERHWFSVDAERQKKKRKRRCKYQERREKWRMSFLWKYGLINTVGPLYSLKENRHFSDKRTRNESLRQTNDILYGSIKTTVGSYKWQRENWYFTASDSGTKWQQTDRNKIKWRKRKKNKQISEIDGKKVHARIYRGN